MNMQLKLDLDNKTLYWIDTTPLITRNIEIFDKLQTLFKSSFDSLTKYFHDINEIDIFINDNEVVATIDEHKISDSDFLILIENKIKKSI